MKGELWLGSEASAAGYVRYLEYMQANPLMLGKTRAEVFGEAEEEEEGKSRFSSYLIKDFGNVGVISIKGGMANSDTWWARIFELTTYPEIIRAASELMDDPGITDIVLDIDSGGGTVDGLENVSRSLKTVSRIKPIHAVTAGTMASAAYWIGAVAKKLYSTEMAQTGSIGVIATHFSIVGMLEQDGIKATVLRAGDYKAPGSPYENLSARDEKILQKELDTLHGFFLEHVVTERGMSMAKKDAWGEGQMFFGAEAVSIGMADGINSPEELVLSLEVPDNVDNPTPTFNNSSNNTGENQMSIEDRRTVILQSEEDRAAVAAGASLNDFEHEEGAASVEEPRAPSATEGTDAGTESVDTSEDGTAAATETPTAMAQLLEMSAENALLKRDLEQANASLLSTASVVNSLTASLGIQINRMEIGLRRSETNFEGMPAAAVITKYNETREAFDAKFKVGRRTTQSMDEPVKVARLGIVPKG